MHEYSIAYDIYMTARQAALDHRAERVICVHVDMGELAMVNPEQVKFLFEAIAEEDTLFSGTDLVCHAVAPAVRCTCGYEGTELYICPACGALPDLVRGREILVTNIEIEVGES
jgi:hydrogenase nickel incorporation protein HypA/HybF